jgi:hypothetical protein
MATNNNPLSIETNAVSGASHPAKIICEFCGCQLGPSGEFLKLGADAKKFRDFPDEKAALEKTIAALNLEVSELKRQLSETEEVEILPTPPQTPKGNTLFK